MESIDSELALWSDYCSSRSLENRNRLFQYYSLWAKKVASSQFALLRPAQVDWSDIVQNASLALIEVIDKFDNSRGVPFKAFAYPRIKGAIIDGLPKSEQIDSEEMREIEEWTNSSTLYFEPEGDEFNQFIDAVLDIAFSEILDMSSRRVTRFSDDPMNAYISLREEQKVVEAIDSLPSDLRFIIISHYNNYLTFSQIANEMALSRGRVSQLHKEALKQLRQTYEATNET
jgi:RNA polymerase sigma factor FliA